jgi:hypothetical protein
MNSISTRAACAWPETHFILLAAGALLAAPVWAGRPLATDDASVLEPHDCQVEAWHQHTGNLREWWAMPACRVSDWELAAGKGQGRASVVQAKTILRAPGTGSDDWALGLTVASQQGPIRQQTLNLPLTISFMEQAVLLHLNAGWMHPHGAATRGTWSVGGEYALSQRWSASVESYGGKHLAPTRQLGVRYTLVANRLDLDASVAKTARSKPQLAFGMTWALPHLLY